MKRQLIIFLVLYCAFVVSGCQFLKDMALKGKKYPPVEAAESIPNMAEGLDLAKVILKPEVERRVISRDPFKPIITETKEEAAVVPANNIESIGDLSLIGVVRTGDEYSALLQTSSQKGVFQKYDMIHRYIIEDIAMDRIVLKDGNKTIIVKRGEK